MIVIILPFKGNEVLYFRSLKFIFVIVEYKQFVKQFSIKIVFNLLTIPVYGLG